MVGGPGWSQVNPGCPEIVLWDVLLKIRVVLLDKIGVVGLLRCLSDSQVKAEQAGPRRRNVSVGDSLFLVIESVSRGGGKSFEGRMRFPPGRQGKQVPVRIGVYGKGIGKWSLKEARDEWDRIRSWSKQNGKRPHQYQQSGESNIHLDTTNPSKRRHLGGIWDTRGSLHDTNCSSLESILVC